VNSSTTQEALLPNPEGSAAVPQLDLFKHGHERPAAESKAFLTKQVLTYIGNKRSLLDFIGQAIPKVQRAVGKERLDTFDVFSGSGVVARYLKRFSRRLVVCDIERYSSIVNSCYLSNRSDLDEAEIREVVTRINEQAKATLRPGFITELYAPADEENIKPGERVFYTRRNAMMIDTVRALIDESVPEHLRTFVLAPLLYVASVHANTSGVFKGFYKNSSTGLGQYGGNGRNALTRICKPFDIPVPVFSQYECDHEVHLGDSNAVARRVPRVDLAYLDPPYNQHPYGSNYFMLNTIAENARPSEISRVSGIPKHWNRSDYNKRKRSFEALRDLVHALDARFLLVSYNSEGFIQLDQMREMLGEVGSVESLETQYNTFRGSRNLRDRDTYVSEHLFLVDRGA